MSRKLRTIFLATLTFILAVVGGVYYLLNSDKLLVAFDINSVTNKFSEFNINFDKVKAADHYRVSIIDSNNIKVYDNNFKDNNISISLANLIFDEEYSLMVYAYDKQGEYRPANKEYLFKWQEPTFDKTNILLDDKDYVFKFNGNVEGKKYVLKLYENNKEIFSEKISTNEMKISSDLYKGKSKIIKCKIINDDVLIDEMQLFNKINPITDLKITSPKSEEILPYGDINLTYEGGDNANNYKLNIKQKGKIMYSATFSKKTAVISKELFDAGTDYELELIASYKSYEKSKSVSFTINEKESLKPVYISSNWKNVKKGTKIELKNTDKNAKIYYTLDNSDPESMGKPYSGPITINNDVKIKTIAISDVKYNSIVSEYDIHVGKKEKLVVYLSPSNQHANMGVESTGFTNERDEMNDLTNYIQERLEKNGVKVVRNKSSGNINVWLKESAYAGADLHIAIHSNASVNHDKYGIETWIYQEKSKTYSLAQQIQNNLMSIYPDNKKADADRGVKYANGALGEANDNYLPFPMLVEIAHHDYESDALWIMQNKKLIGYNLADTILKYYQII